MTTLYVTADKAQLKQASGQRNALLWGDAVTVEGDPVADQVLCKAHGCTGTVPRSSLGPDDPGLLEVYVIDVGQGDSILIRTPDRKWHLVDGGPPKSKALLGKNARRFLAWKFARDLGQATVALDTVVLSHSDLDHFGGLTEILTSDFEPSVRPGLRWTGWPARSAPSTTAAGGPRPCPRIARRGRARRPYRPPSSASCTLASRSSRTGTN